MILLVAFESISSVNCQVNQNLIRVYNKSNNCVWKRVRNCLFIRICNNPSVINTVRFQENRVIKNCKMNVCTFYSPFQNDVTGKYQKNYQENCCTKKHIFWICQKCKLNLKNILFSKFFGVNFVKYLRLFICDVIKVQIKTIKIQSVCKFYICKAKGTDST